MKKFLLAGVALSALIAGPAMAADLPARGPVYKAAPPVMTYFSWTGCYVGGHVGGVWSQRDWSVGAGDPFFLPGQAFGSHDANGWLGGAQVGCNYQTGPWVFGIQGDYAWTDASGSGADSLNAVLFPGATISSNMKGLSSVTGRVGYAWDRFLGYVKGGGAWVQEEYTATAGPFVGTASQTRSGWTVGVGGEYAFTNNFTGFIEYNYYGFDDKSVTLASGLGGVYNVVNVKQDLSVVKIGVNWKFGKGPVVANY
jgi:outer membrane immunogenic protein